MPDAVIAPTIVLGIEDLGHRVAQRLEDDARVLDAPPVRFLKARRTDPVGDLEERLRAAIDELSRTRLNRSSRGRLDVVVVADLAAAGCAARARLAVEVISKLVLEEFPAALPMRREPSQRSVCVVGLFAARALVNVDSVRPVHEIEAWARGEQMPALSRIHLLSRQHEGGVLTEEDVERGLYMFAASVWFSGLRDSETINALVAHRASDALICPFNAAAADVPVDLVVRYFAWRSAWAGLEVLHDRCAVPAEMGPSSDAGLLRYDQWIRSLSSSDAARRALGVFAPTMEDSTSPVRPNFGWFEPRSRIEAELGPILRGPGLEIENSPEELGPAPPPEDVLVALDREERSQLAESVRQIDAFVGSQLDPQEALKRLPGTLRALKDAREGLEARLKESVEPQGRVIDGGAAISDSRVEKAAVLRAIDARPGPARLVLTSVGLAALAIVLTIGIWVSVAAAPSSGPTGPTSQPVASGVTVTSSSRTTSTAAGWKLGLLAVLIGAGVGGGWFAFMGRSASTRLRDAVLDLDRVRDRGQRRTASPGAHTAPSALALRERRLARAALRSVDAASLRVKGLRAAITEARERARMELRSLGYHQGTRNGGDASAVLGRESPLHRRLIATGSLERLWKETKETAEVDNWARDLLVAAWPESGISLDLPFEPDGAWETTTCVQEHRRLLEASAFRWREVQDEVASAVGDFLARAVDEAVVGMPVEPADEDHEPLQSNRETEFYVVAPQEARGAVEASKAGVRRTFQANWGVTAVSRIVVLRIHPGCTSQNLAWGIQARERR
jgi:hypothetical protein